MEEKKESQTLETQLQSKKQFPWLKPWKKGQSGNPGGRPKRELVTTHIERELLREMDDNPSVTKARAIAEKVVAMALGGNPWAVQFCTERTEGKPDQHVSISATVAELTEDDLRNIAARSGDGTAEAHLRPQEPSSVH